MWRPLSMCRDGEWPRGPVRLPPRTRHLLVTTTDIDARWTVGIDFVSPGRIRAKYRELTSASHPHQPSVQREIENTDEYACNRENGWGDIGIDQLVQIVEQEASLVRLDPRLSVGAQPPRSMFRFWLRRPPSKRTPIRKSLGTGCEGWVAD